jgi:hypothetical protein
MHSLPWTVKFGLHLRNIYRGGEAGEAVTFEKSSVVREGKVQNLHIPNSDKAVILL